MRIAIIGDGLTGSRAYADREDTVLLAFDADTGAPVAVRLDVDADRVAALYRAAAPAALDTDVTARVVLDRPGAGIVNVLADEEGGELLVLDAGRPGVPIWIGSVSPENVDALANYAEEAGRAK